MNEDDFYLSVLIGIVSGLIVLFGSFIAEGIQTKWLKFSVIIVSVFVLYMIFVKILQKRISKKRKWHTILLNLDFKEKQNMKWREWFMILIENST